MIYLKLLDLWLNASHVFTCRFAEVSRPLTASRELSVIQIESKLRECLQTKYTDVLQVSCWTDSNDMQRAALCCSRFVFCARRYTGKTPSSCIFGWKVCARDMQIPVVSSNIRLFCSFFVSIKLSLELSEVHFLYTCCYSLYVIRMSKELKRDAHSYKFCHRLIHLITRV